MNKIFTSLYWKISFLFLILMLLVGGVYVTVTSMSVNQFYLETKQLLCKDVSHQVIDDVELFKDGALNESGIQHVMMHHMKVNPSAEVYVLDTLGHILTYDAPPEKIKTTQVPVEKIKEYIDNQGEKFLTGTDPRNPEATKIFSACPIIEQDHLKGYVYVILSSEEYENVASSLFTGFMYNVGKKSLLITLLVAIVFGLIAIWYLTKNLRIIQKGVERFEQEDFSNKIKLNSKGEFADLAQTLNNMADTIDGNIKQLKSMESLRKELVANVSHDLRTPLAIIHGYAETLVMKDDTISKEDRVKFLNNILKSTNNLEKLVSELFELSKLESNKIKLKKEKVNLSELLNDIVGRYQILANKKEISLTLKVEGVSYVQIDIALMERAIQNLVENALKFTAERGEVKLKVSEQNGFLKVEVQDNGVGIEEEYLPFVFDRYKKLSKDKDNNPGAGLGLAIVKKILDLHGVSVVVASIKGEGTVFSFRIASLSI
ncbi:MAG: signal transduction histidine kinase [Saprospiraceae bacterium]|jgi:signal transduction histidine kinase